MRENHSIFSILNRNVFSFLKRYREIADYGEQHKEFENPQPIAFMNREGLLENAYRKVNFLKQIKKLRLF
jgi:hypothetical protein